MNIELLIIEILVIVILFEIIVIGLIYIKNLFYNIFKGFWEKETEYWKQQYKDLQYDYNKLKEMFREKFGEEGEQQ